MTENTHEPMVLREGQCQSYITLTDTDVDLYCDYDEGHGPDHLCRLPQDGLVAGRDWDEVVGQLDEPTAEMEAMLVVDVEVRWTWPKREEGSPAKFTMNQHLQGALAKIRADAPLVILMETEQGSTFEGEITSVEEEEHEDAPWVVIKLTGSRYD